MSTENASSPEGLDAELVQRLVAAVGARLDDGEVLIAAPHFYQALCEEYASQGGEGEVAEVEDELRGVVRDLLAVPESSSIIGIENWLTRSFLAQMKQAGWKIGQIQEEGAQELRDLIRQPKVRALLDQCGLKPQQINLRRCQARVATMVAGRVDQRARRRQPPVVAAPAPEERQEQRVYRLEALPEPSEAEVEERKQEQMRLKAELRAEQLEALVANAESYIRQGKLSSADVERLRQQAKINAAVVQGRVSSQKGEKIRNSLMDGKVRFALDKKVRQATDFAVLYLQVFEALRRIDPRYDTGLSFIIRHKEVVNANTVQLEDMGVLVKELLGENERLNALIALLDREDAEVRLMAAKLPPYGNLAKSGQERVANMVVEEEFIDSWRQSERQEVAQSLQDEDAQTRVRAAADMHCLHGLILRLLRPTPIRKEIRILKINLIIEEFYRDTDDMDAARSKAQAFLQTRLQKLYPDLTPDESEAIEARSKEFIEALEQRLRREREPEKTDKAGPDAGGGELDADELAKGIFVGRVAVRIAGKSRQIPYKIMPDDEQQGAFVLVVRQPKSGKITPVLRQGAKRYVEKDGDGNWVLTEESR
jgi:hypothetical protein